MKRLLSALLIGVVTLGCGCKSPSISPTDVAYKKHAVERFYKHIQDASVTIRAKGPQGEVLGHLSGTIVAVEDDGRAVILTARHGTEIMDKVPGTLMYIVYKRKSYLAHTTDTDRNSDDPTQDFDLLRTYIDQPFSVCPIADSAPTLGEAIFVNPHAPWTQVTIMRGWMSNIAPNGMLALIDIDGTYGVSGSAVINEEGKVYGVLIGVQTYETFPSRVPVAGTTLVCLVVR